MATNMNYRQSGKNDFFGCRKEFHDVAFYQILDNNDEQKTDVEHTSIHRLPINK